MRLTKLLFLVILLLYGSLAGGLPARAQESSGNGFFSVLNNMTQPVSDGFSRIFGGSPPPVQTSSQPLPKPGTRGSTIGGAAQEAGEVIKSAPGNISTTAGHIISGTSVGGLAGTLGTAAVDVLGGVIGGVSRGEDFGDALEDSVIASGGRARTGNRKLDEVVRQGSRGARNGGSLSDVIEGAVGGGLRGISTGDNTLNRVIRDVGRRVGGSFGRVLRNFGLRADLGCEGASLGGVICNTVFAHALVPGLLSGLSYLFGLYLGILGIIKIREHVEAPSQVQIWEPIKRFIAGGAFFALPLVLEALYNTLAFGLRGIGEGGGYGPVDAGDSLSAGGLDDMLVRLMDDIWEPTIYLLSGFSYLAGIVLAMIGISRLLKSEQEGPRGPAGIATLMTLLAAGALLSADAMMGAFSFSLFKGQEQYGVDVFCGEGLEAVHAARVGWVISAAMAFVAIIGWISFLRGIFMLRAVAEGGQQASPMAAATHLFGGAIAVNLGPLLTAVQITLGIVPTSCGVSFM